MVLFLLFLTPKQWEEEEEVQKEEKGEEKEEENFLWCVFDEINEDKHIKI